jgi:hypothetical protein
MNEHFSYQHLERFGTDETEGITLGKVYVFPKIDGTNASVWMDDDGNICAGSRNRKLSLEADNGGFFRWVLDQNFQGFFRSYPYIRLFGEWLIPHSLKTYRKDAWRRFYVFDVLDLFDRQNAKYLPYDVYKPLLDVDNIEYIAPLRIIHNPTTENLYSVLDENDYLIEDGKGKGEGIVLKNYDYQNKYGRQTWAKIVTSEFKEAHKKEMGAPESTGIKLIEETIIEKFATEAFIEKTFQKIVNDGTGWTSRMIPQLLSRCLHDLITEESWNIVKGYKMPKIDFKTLNMFLIQKIKRTKPELF